MTISMTLYTVGSLSNQSQLLCNLFWPIYERLGSFRLFYGAAGFPKAILHLQSGTADQVKCLFKYANANAVNLS